MWPSSYFLAMNVGNLKYSAAVFSCLEELVVMLPELSGGGPMSSPLSLQPVFSSVA